MEMTSKAKATDSTADAYRAIKELIFSRALNPGQKLLYRDLCEMIGMSKTPIVNALSRLTYEDFVVYEPNRGYRIKPIHESEISHLFEIRLELECLNVRNAIRNCNAQGLKNLQKKFDLWSNYLPAFTDKAKLLLDMDFHLEIARIGENSYSITFLNTVIEHIHFRYRLERYVEDRKEEIEREHKGILKCIEERDDSGALKYTTQHINALHGLMLKHFKEMKKMEGEFWSP